MNTDHNMFVTFGSINNPIMSIFVDNIKVIGAKKSDHIKKIQAELAIIFEMININLIPSIFIKD